MKTLHLTLKKKWFDMIASGEKKEEYREIKKYWATRLTNGCEAYISELLPKGYGYQVAWKDYDSIKFTNGYSKAAPTITVKCEGIDIGVGMTKWGAMRNTEYFIIKLGEIITTS
jgi:hypothetical protein